MKKNIKLVEVTSELGAGTRGASLGVGALKTAAYNKNSKFFTTYSSESVPNFNEHIFSPSDTPGAIRIEFIVKQFELIVSQIKSTIERGEFPFVLAGDHSTAAATIAGIQQAHPNKRLGVVWVDAHGDLHSPYTSPTGNVHGMPLAMACNIDNEECKVRDISPKAFQYWEKIKSMSGKALHTDDLVFVGVRDTEKPEDFLIKEKGIKNFEVAEVEEKGGERVGEDILERLSECDLLYVSFDVDSMDPIETSHGTGTPVPNGLKVDHVTELLQTLCASDKLVCFETVEVNPTLDEKKNKMAEVTIGIVEKVASVISQ
jgi:arginase